VAKNVGYLTKYQQNTNALVDEKRVFVELVFWLVDEKWRLVDLWELGIYLNFAQNCYFSF